MDSPYQELPSYIQLGGFPATHLKKYCADEVYTIVIYISTVFLDIVKRGQIKKSISWSVLLNTP